MPWVSRAGRQVVTLTALPMALLGAPAARAQAPQPPAPASVEAIEEAYNRQLLRLDRQRIEQLARLAAGQAPEQAAATYERLFRHALAAEQFREAEAAAVAVLEKGTPSTTTNAFAHLVRILAEADRGAFDASLQSLRAALAENAGAAPKAAGRARLSAAEVLEICDAYYQRLVEAGRIATAREAFRLVLAADPQPAVKEFVEGRLKRLDLVGQPAPAVAGTDLDGKTFDLAAEKGKAVLLVFWASWCVPSSTQVEWLQQVDEAYRDKGLRIVGIDVEGSADGAANATPDALLPAVRRFILDHNIRWPNLVNGAGPRDYAGAYGVADIPANVLIGPDGKVAQVDLNRRSLEPALAKLLAR